MSIDQPYNELGQILAGGGQIALGLALARGVDSSGIALLFARRFDPIRSQDAVTLRQLAERGIAAADELNQVGPADTVDISHIPTIPELFGDSPEGRRFFFIVEVDITGEGSWRELRLELADFTGNEQLREEALAEAERRANKSPGKFGQITDDDEEELNMRVVLGFKRF